MPSIRLLTAGGFLAFLVFGFVDNLKGPLLPHMLRAESFSYQQGATILLAGYLGFIISTLLSGILADIVDSRAVLFVASGCLAIGCLGIGLAESHVLWAICLGVVGLGLGAIELGSNALLVELHPRNSGRYLNLLGMFHGIGSLSVPLVAAWMLTADFHWQSIYGASALLAVPLALVFGWALLCRRPSAGPLPSGSILNSAANHGWQWRCVVRDAFTRRMSTYYVILAAYVAAELGTATWMVEFLQHERAMTVGRSAGFLSMFFVLLTLGRLVGAYIVERVGYTPSLTAALIISSLCLTWGIFGEGGAIYALPVSGLFMSIVFPTIAAAGADSSPANTGTMLGILFSFAGIGGAMGPWLIGLVSDRAGLQSGLACTIGFSVIALLGLLTLPTAAAARE